MAASDKTPEEKAPAYNLQGNLMMPYQAFTLHAVPAQARDIAELCTFWEEHPRASDACTDPLMLFAQVIYCERKLYYN